MKTPKCLSVALLSATLAFAPISVSANAIPIPASTAEPIQLPKVDAKDLAKKIAKVGRTNAVAFAVDKLFEGIDWVMDPANNQAITKNKIYCQSHAICVDNLAEAETYALQSTFVTEWKYPFTGCQFHDNWGNGVIACTFTQDGDIRTIVFYNEGQKIATYDQIAQEILNNALQGHLDSIKFVQEVAEEKAKEEGQPAAVPIALPKVDEKPKEEPSPNRENCIPPPKTQCYEYNEGHAHKGFDPHYHIWQHNKRNDGFCQWNKMRDKKHTLDGNLPPPTNMLSCQSYPSWVGRPRGIDE